MKCAVVSSSRRENQHFRPNAGFRRSSTPRVRIGTAPVEIEVDEQVWTLRSRTGGSINLLLTEESVRRALAQGLVERVSSEECPSTMESTSPSDELESGGQRVGGRWDGLESM